MLLFERNTKQLNYNIARFYVKKYEKEKNVTQ